MNIGKFKKLGFIFAAVICCFFHTTLSAISIIMIFIVLEGNRSDFTHAKMIINRYTTGYTEV